ncbi:MAG: Gfo/Idh/MocA family oxidoreductase [Cyclobacteriaceae bacterium]|nr:Gfo/Idh/MocA family oxidoreductase [Cyclobacteriaceae bacterium]
MEVKKFGIVGCGHIGKRHAAVLDHYEFTKPVSVCDLIEARAQEQAELYGEMSVFKNFDDFIKEDFDVVSICTPHHLHKPMALAALKAGKHVVVEKPMALSAKDASDMTQAAKDAGLKLYVVKQNRYNVPIQLVEEALKNNRLGKIYMVQCNVLWNRHQEYYDQSDWRGNKEKEQGALFTQASHFIDILVWWFGKIIEAKTVTDTQAHNIEIEDCGQSSVKFDSGVIGSISWTTNVYNKNFEGSITIIGENGTVKVGGAYLNKVEFWDVKSYPLPENISYVDLPNNYGKYQGSSSNHHKVIEEVVKDLNGERSNIVEGQEGAKSIEAIETIYKGTDA